jgi:tRNA dimethylallyltransferase
MQQKHKCIVIVGPTCSGKSDLALTLASDIHTEIISADSRLVYRYMDIGTAKPSRDELNSVKHHFIDIIDPDQIFSAADFKKNADSVVSDLHADNLIPVIAGGTGQYVWSLLENWQFVDTETNYELRNSLLKRAENGDNLYEELLSKDPLRASQIDPRNIRRVVRALELIYDEKQRPGITKLEPLFDFRIIGLTCSREYLYKRIDERVDMMIKNGLLEEVKSLLTRYSENLPSMSGIGYKQIISYIKGEMSLSDAIASVKTNTHRLARMQYNWFKLSDERIQWFDIEDPEYKVKALNYAKMYIN